MTLQRKTPLKRSPMKRSGRPIPRESKKRQDERPIRDAVRAETLARQPECVAKHLPTLDRGGKLVRCGGRLEVDEIVSRARRPGGHLDPANTQTLCAIHNTWKEDHPKLAKELGLARSASPRGVVDP